MTDRPFLLQMAGEPGTGKSTVALAIGEITDAVVLDKDIVKSAALELGIDDDTAGSLSYQTLFGLAKSLLAQNHNVIIDSPAHFPEIRHDGRNTADEASAVYHLIECIAPAEVVEDRLASRDAMPSQITKPEENPYDRDGTKPLSEPRLILDMARPMDECVRTALEYIAHDSR